MADVADGRLWTDAGTGASLHCAGERNRPSLWPETLHDGDAKALWRARSPPGGSRVCRRRTVGRRLCDPRLGLAASAPQGVVLGFPPCRPLVRRDDGASRRQARHGSEAGLNLFSSPSPRSCGERVGRGALSIGEFFGSIESGTPSPGSQRRSDLSPQAGRGEEESTHARLASNAIRSASPASTVPISQRCSNNQVGRVPRNSAIEPAASAIMALTLTLIAIWIDPSASDCVSTLPCAGSMNCGNSARYSMAIFGLSRLVTKPIANSLRGPSTASFF